MKNRLKILIILTAIFGISNFNLSAHEVTMETRTEPTKKISSELINFLRRNKKILTISTATLTAIFVSAGVYYNKEKIRGLFISKPKDESEADKSKPKDESKAQSGAGQENPLEVQDKAAKKQAETDAMVQELLVETVEKRSSDLAAGIQARQLKREQEDKIQGDEQPSESTAKVGNSEKTSKNKKKNKAARDRAKKRLLAKK